MKFMHCHIELGTRQIFLIKIILQTCKDIVIASKLMGMYPIKVSISKERKEKYKERR